jgi:hypothetical protein
VESNRSGLWSDWFTWNRIRSCGQTRSLTCTGSRNIEVEYRSSIDYQIEDTGTTNEWTQVCPFPLPVLSAWIANDGLGHRYRTEFRYRNAYYDGQEKEFRGFEAAVQTDVGKANEGAPTLVSSLTFDTGRSSEALRARSRGASRCSGKVFSRTRN